MIKRPLAIIVLSIVYIAAGAVGLVYHLSDFKPSNPFPTDLLWVSVVRLLAIVAGIFMLRGLNWARWLAVAWIAFHVAISFLNSMQQVLVHSLFLAVIAYLLFRPEANAYFRRVEPAG